ncbi:MAG: redox-sensing transcriptional repressor Rex [Clostridia bacterium]|nr:redox-sensing transcriptional repressor Rex [Clostridia bacterium]
MPNKPENISMSVIKRLPRYYRFLGNLKKNGVVRISSKELSSKMGFTASQIRQDLNCFGGFGQQGYGYNVEQLYNEIGTILGVNNGNKAIIIGMGNLGKAMASHMKFAKSGFNIIGLFDSDKSLSGENVNGMEIRHMSSLSEFCNEHSPKVAVLCIPETAAEGIVSELVSLGVNNFWNFSHYDVAANFPGTVSENVHLNDSLMTLNYQMMNKAE